MFLSRSLNKIIRGNVVALMILLGSLCQTATASPWQRVVVIGASASSGFTLSEPFGGTNTLKCRLCYYLDSAIAVPHAPVQNLSTALLFLNPEGLGQQQVEVAVQRKPTLVIGVDFLFWYCYGDGPGNDDRRQRFDRGLKLLEQFSCPLVVGDIPDASYATNSGIISPDQVPSHQALANANLRLRQWAVIHTNVTILPLAHLMKTINAHESLVCHGQMLSAPNTVGIIQDDHLHPTPRGAAWLALQTLDVFTAKTGDDLANDILWNPAVVYRSGHELSQKSVAPTDH